MDKQKLQELIANTNAAIAEAETRKLFHGFEYESTKTKWDLFEQWKKAHALPLEDMATMGEQFTYRVTPTSLGSVVVVVDEVSKEEFTLTDWALFG